MSAATDAAASTASFYLQTACQDMDASGVWGVTYSELEQALAAVDPSAVLAPARIVRRVLRHDRNLAESGLRIPHRKTFFVRRATLAEDVEPSELNLRSFDDLPETVILLARPEQEQLAETTRARMLLKYWRLLFHARVHVELDRLVAEERLDATAVDERIARLGRLEFEEVRSVLRQENMLLPPVDDVSTYIEFVAVYCELKHFAPRLVADYFPSLRSTAVVDEVIARDFDSARWFEATRLPGSPEPHEQTIDDEEVLTERRADPSATNPRKQSERFYCRLMLMGDRAKARGNDVRSAVMRWWAALRIGPKLAKEARDDGREDVRRLSFRVSRALEADDRERSAWTAALEELLPPATRGLWTHERRFLYDLQKACVDFEQGVFQLDVWAWLVSRGERPLKRELPHQREVLIVKHLRSALRRLAVLRISTPSRDRLTMLLRGAIERAEEKVREKLRPRIVEAFDEVGLRPANRPEQTARKKLIEELLDRTVDRGFLNMGDLRDAVSRNNLKLHDLDQRNEWLTGDEGLRADKALAARLEGVYRAGEIYRRMPQWLSSVAFGTVYGRLAMRYVVVPFGGAFIVLKFLQEMFLHMPTSWEGVHGFDPCTRWAIFSLGCFFLLLYRPSFRARCLEGIKAARRGFEEAFVAWPKRLLALPWVRRVVDSRAYRLLQQFVFKPLLTTFLLAVLVSVMRVRVIRWPGLLGLFVLANLSVNSRVGRRIDEAVTDVAARSWHQFRFRIVGTVVQATMDFFHEALEWMDRALYAVDEWLRFRSGEARAATAVKAVLASVWFVVNYVIRFVVTLLVEPQINPIKHFPVVTVSHKIILPMGPFFVSLLAADLGMGLAEANAIVWSTIWLIPGVFGFLVWELKENWRLYDANRPATLQPMRVGSHGETVSRLLRPGFHSGTIPKNFARLRRADRKAMATGSWQGPRKYHDRLHHAGEDIERFVKRDLLEPLSTSVSCGPLGLHLAEAVVGTSHSRLTLVGGEAFAQPMKLTIADEHGWLTARTAMPEWYDRLDPEQARTLTLAVAGWYKMCGVELVHEQIEECFGPDAPRYELYEDGIAVYPDPLSDAPVRYDLRHLPDWVPLVSPSTPAAMPTLDRQRLVFASAPIRWRQWVEVWDRDGRSPDEVGATVVI